MFIIIEPFAHHEVLDAIFRFFSLEKDKRPITCITNHYCFEHSDFQSADWITWKVDDNIEQLIQTEKKLLYNASKILFTTIDIHSTFWNDNSYPYTMAIVHNGNNFFNLHNDLKLSVFHLSKYAYYKLRGDLKKNQKIAQQLKKILVPSPSIKTYLNTKIENTLANKIQYIDFPFPQYTPIIHSSKDIRIVIPGSIAHDRRDYKLVTRILPSLDKIPNAPQIKLIFLGKVHDKSIKQTLLNISLKNIELIFFNGHVNKKTFETNMKTCDFLWLPLTPKTCYKSIIELRGKTCVSGNINDMVQFSLPALIPNYYPLSIPLDGMVAQYDEKNFLEVFTSWIQSKKYNHIKKEIPQILQQYKKEVMANYHKTLS